MAPPAGRGAGAGVELRDEVEARGEPDGVLLVEEETCFFNRWFGVFVVLVGVEYGSLLISSQVYSNRFTCAQPVLRTLLDLADELGLGAQELLLVVHLIEKRETDGALRVFVIMGLYA